jgi:hypothetical protein
VLTITHNRHARTPCGTPRSVSGRRPAGRIGRRAMSRCWHVSHSAGLTCVLSRAPVPSVASAGRARRGRVSTTNSRCCSCAHADTRPPQAIVERGTRRSGRAREPASSPPVQGRRALPSAGLCASAFFLRQWARYPRWMRTFSPPPSRPPMCVVPCAARPRNRPLQHGSREVQGQGIIIDGRCCWIISHRLHPSPGPQAIASS